MVASEILWKKNIVRGEISRKLVHVLVGCFVAIWPWLLSWQAIELISLAMLGVVYIIHRYHFLHALFNAKRRSLGEYSFAATIGLVPFITHNKTFFMIALLHMALADGLAAIFGKNYGKKWSYSFSGYHKTLVGTMVFWLVSVWIVGLGLLANNGLHFDYYILAVVIVPPIATLMENVAIRGTDNLFIPLAVAAVLEIMSKY